jgi:hypothetical protein
VAGGLVLMGYETLQTSYAIKDIAPRLVTGFILANTSGELTSKAIDFANALSGGLIGPGVNMATAMNSLEQRINAHTDHEGDFMFAIYFVAAILAVVLAALYALRVTLVLVVAAPLMLATHALPQTEGLARLWRRAMSGVLEIQVAQALVFTVLTTVMFTVGGPESLAGAGPLWDMLLMICLLYVMIRIPAWISQQVLTGGARRSPLTHAARYIVYRNAISSSVYRAHHAHRRRR